MKQTIRTALKAFTSQKRDLSRRQEADPVQKSAVKAPNPTTSLFSVKRLDEAIQRAKDRFLSIQNAKGYWVFDLEADTTIPSEYILLQRFLNRETSTDLKERIGHYIRHRQLEDGGWPLYHEGTGDISASVKTYLALKQLGDSPNTPHMIKAREFILSRGGAAKVNVFTRITLALFGQIPWRTTPAMPVEIMLLPKWFFFHLQKVSYWSRTVIVPLLILNARRPVCRLRPEEGLSELFVEPPHELRHLDHLVPRNLSKNLFIFLDRILKMVDPIIPRTSREKATRLAERWTVERMQGEGGIGAIFPAMANAVMALNILGYPDDHPDVARGLKAIDDLLVDHGHEAFCQPCVSPIWDTCLSLSAVLEAGVPQDHRVVQGAVDWLFKNLIQVPGDWSYRAPDLEPAGWAFQFENTFYPDVDDTPMVIMALLRAGIMTENTHKEKIAKTVNWVVGMQSSDGGWGAFDIDNNYLYLNNIPFADHGALLDPSTSDLTGRCIELLSMLGYGPDFPPIAKALTFLRKEQEDFGGWFGRWGVNYIYGTWSVLKGLGRLGEDVTQPYIQKAVEWLKSCQNPDNGWGETCYSYKDPSLAGKGKSTASQTAWALLGLMAVGEVESSAVQRGIHYLITQQDGEGRWDEQIFTGTGFPNVFYLRYHGYSQFFPLWALSEYRRLRAGRATRQDEVSLRSSANFFLPALKNRP
ncbi:MAG: squalene--hopene cyclase [Deltaproteobacteria bacterium]|nr:squalene--hopene cyclase [Deltaproteobacteria bacterium]